MDESCIKISTCDLFSARVRALKQKLALFKGACLPDPAGRRQVKRSVLPMVMSAVALPSVTSVKVSGDTSLHFVKAMPMAFLVSSTFRVLGNLMILRWKRQTDNWTLIGPQRMMLRLL